MRVRLRRPCSGVLAPDCVRQFTRPLPEPTTGTLRGHWPPLLTGLKQNGRRFPEVIENSPRARIPDTFWPFPSIASAAAAAGCRGGAEQPAAWPACRPSLFLAPKQSKNAAQLRCNCLAPAVSPPLRCKALNCSCLGPQTPLFEGVKRCVNPSEHEQEQLAWEPPPPRPALRVRDQSVFSVAVTGRRHSAICRNTATVRRSVQQNTAALNTLPACLPAWLVNLRVSTRIAFRNTVPFCTGQI